MLVRNSRTIRVLYWVNFSASSGAGLPGLSRMESHSMVVVVLLAITPHFNVCLLWLVVSRSTFLFSSWYIHVQIVLMQN